MLPTRSLVTEYYGTTKKGKKSRKPRRARNSTLKRLKPLNAFILMYDVWKSFISTSFMPAYGQLLRGDAGKAKKDF